MLKARSPIGIIIREGEVFYGRVDLVSPYEIKMILDNGSKVIVFRHSVLSLKVCSRGDRSY